jgi:hypothetical protein
MSLESQTQVEDPLFSIFQGELEKIRGDYWTK